MNFTLGSEKPLLSVCLITYNHEQYIAQAIESVLMQETDFSCEFIIAEDCSPDNTREIVSKYGDKYPIKLILQKENKHVGNWLDLMKSPTGKYVAFFDGDDYWTDKYKLQKQVDFLESNPDFSICFHDVSFLKNGILSNSGSDFTKDVFDLYDYARDGFIHTTSVVYRNFGYDILPSFIREVYAGDRMLFSALAKRGLIKYLPDNMAVYRIHEKGIWSMQAPISISEKKVNDILLILQKEDDKELIRILKQKLYQEYRFLSGSTNKTKYLLKCFLLKPVLTIKHQVKSMMNNSSGK